MKLNAKSSELNREEFAEEYTTRRGVWQSTSRDRERALRMCRCCRAAADCSAAALDTESLLALYREHVFRIVDNKIHRPSVL